MKVNEETTEKNLQLREKPLEDQIFRVLTNRKFSRKKPNEKTSSFLLEKIRGALDNLEPLKLIIGFGYHKNPNATSNFLPDLAEELSFQHLYKLAEKIREIYQPGMRITVFTTGKTAEIANDMSSEKTLLYHRALREMVIRKKWEETIEVISVGDLHKERWDEFQETLLDVKKEIKEKWIDSRQQEFWETQIEHARRNINRRGISKEEAEVKAKRAAFNYVVIRTTEKKIRLFEKKFPKEIMASYNMGHKNTLVLFTLGKGNVTQPWQGEAKLINGKVIVMTQKRQKKYEKQSCQI